LNSKILTRDAVCRYSSNLINLNDKGPNIEIPERYLERCSTVFSYLNNNSRRCVVNSTYYVPKFRIAKFRDLMFKTNIEKVPLFLNTPELRLLAKWRLGIGK
jgi:hypothetical protein